MVFVTVDFACVVLTERHGLAKKGREELQATFAEPGLLCKPGLKAQVTDKLLLFQGPAFSAILGAEAEGLSCLACSICRSLPGLSDRGCDACCSVNFILPPLQT